MREEQASSACMARCATRRRRLPTAISARGKTVRISANLGGGGIDCIAGESMLFAGGSERRSLEWESWMDIRCKHICQPIGAGKWHSKAFAASGNSDILRENPKQATYTNYTPIAMRGAVPQSNYNPPWVAQCMGTAMEASDMHFQQCKHSDEPTLKEEASPRVLTPTR